jgi:hypothetical protein
MSIQIVEVESSGLSGITIVEVNQGPAGAAATVDQTIIDGSANAVSGNAVFDGLALKAPLANPTFTGIVTAPRITGRCDGLEVFCKASLAINAGQVVYVTGASGNNIIIGLAQANAEATSSKTIGISESTLATNGTGYVITEGLMTVSISAPSAIEGDPIWLSPSTAGGMVFGAANKPVAPNHMVYLGVITRKTGNNVVEIYVKIQNGSELDELSDVLITSPTAGQALMRGATLWENRSLVATDISDSTTAGRALLTAADAAAQRTSLGLGTAATTASTDYATAAQGTDERVPTAAGLTTKFGTAKATPVDADKVAILDSAASDAPKHSTLTAIWTWIQSKFAGASSKTTPIDADSFNIVDSADSNAAKRVTGTNLKAFLKTYLDTLYVALTGNQTVAGNKTFSGDLSVSSDLLTGSTTKIYRGGSRFYHETGSASMFLGTNSGSLTTTGTSNFAVGTNTLSIVSTGSRNVALGQYAGGTITTGSRNMLIGDATGYPIQVGSDNIGIGYNSLRNITDSAGFTQNIGIGSNTLGNDTGSGNTSIGGESGVSITSGTNNTIIGYFAGRSSLATATNSTAIGYKSNFSASNTIALGGTGGDAAKVTIGGTSAAEALDVTGSAKVSGTLTVGGTNTWNGSTIAGAQAFSSTTRPTSSGTGTPASNSLITRADADSRYWSPRMISGITLYLDANELLYQGTATPTDGSEVVSWKSAHRNGTSEISIVQTGATLKPLFKTSVQNSLNGVLFDGSNDLLQSATGYNGFVANTGRTVFVVCKPTVQVSTGSGTSYARPQLVSNLSQFNGIAVSPSGSGNIFTAWDYDSSGALIQASTAAVATNTAVVITNRHQTGTSLIQVNKSTPVTATTLRECTNGSVLQIGTSGGSAYYTGYIFETIIFGRALSNDEISAVQDFLISKWGI